MLHFHSASNNYQACITMLQCVITDWDRYLLMVSTMREVLLKIIKYITQNYDIKLGLVFFVLLSVSIIKCNRWNYFDDKYIVYIHTDTSIILTFHKVDTNKWLKYKHLFFKFN